MADKLFAVYLGGRAGREGRDCNTELHDVVFVSGGNIDDTYENLMDLWFGYPEGLHIDSWLELNIVDGHRVILRDYKSESQEKLYFINLGAYRKGEFTEYHANTFVVATERKEIINRAKEVLLRGLTFVHTDDIYDLDDCIEIEKAGKLYVHLEKTTEPECLIPNNGYKIIPKPVVAEYISRHPGRKR